jgi:hypothetical protein
MKINITLNPNVPKSQLHDPRVISGLAAVAAVTFGPEAGNLADKTLEFGVINQAGAFSVQFPKAGCMGRSLFRGDEEAVKTLTSQRSRASASLTVGPLSRRSWRNWRRWARPRKFGSNKLHQR